MGKALELSGLRFGRLVVTERVGVDRHRYVTWRCVCDCGNEIVARGRHLRIGDVRSCGCLQRDSQRRSGRLTKHGHYVGGRPSPTYTSWKAMKERCLNGRDPYFHRYGGRGISVCDRWIQFECFLFDMGERPVGTTLDRIDNDGNYEPGNCRWATYQEQAHNRSLPARRIGPGLGDLPSWVTVDWLRNAIRYLDRSAAR